MVALLFSGCCFDPPPDQPLPLEGYWWVPYQSTQPVVFQSNAGNYDTLDVNFSQEYYSYNNECGFDVEERQCRLFPDKYPDVLFYFNANGKYLNLGVYFGLGGATNFSYNSRIAYFDYVRREFRSLHESIAYRTVDTINNVVYSDVLWMQLQNNTFSSIDEFYYARLHGLIQYTDSNNVVWNKVQ